jgi:hypothetical protein
MKSLSHSLTFLTEETEEKSGTIATFRAHQTGIFLDTSVIYNGVKTCHRLRICPRDAKLLLDYLNLSIGE